MLKVSRRELTLVAVFAALWISLQINFGPIIGRLSIGPISMHGAINHLIGWLLMTILAALTGKFGRVTLLALTAAIGTRVIRAQAIEGVLVGVGIALAGIIFDALYFSPIFKHNPKKVYLLVAAGGTGVITLVPWLIFRFYILGPAAFIVLLPNYMFIIARNIFLSTFGTYIAIQILPKVKRVYREAQPSQQVAVGESHPLTA